MLLVASHHFAGSVVVDIMGAEHRFGIVGAKRVELLQVVTEFRGDVRKSISALMSITALVCSGRMCRDTNSSKRWVKAGTFSTFMDNPAA